MYVGHPYVTLYHSHAVRGILLCDMLSYLIAEDQILASFIAGLRTPVLTSVITELTKLGNVWVAGAFVCVVACFLFYKKEFRASLALILSYLGSAYTVALIKDVVMRARPSAPIALLTERFGSFPSLHATLSVSVYALAIALILRRTHSRHKRRVGVLIAMSLVVSIGFSRLYLGVHYPLDVLGGYLVGLIWFLLGRKMSRLHSRYRRST